MMLRGERTTLSSVARDARRAVPPPMRCRALVKLGYSEGQAAEAVARAGANSARPGRKH